MRNKKINICCTGDKCRISISTDELLERANNIVTHPNFHRAGKQANRLTGQLKKINNELKRRGEKMRGCVK